MIISIINDTELKKEEVQRVIRAVNRQMAEDFRRYWHRDVQLRLEGWTGEQPDPSVPLDMRGDAVIYLWDKEDIDDALGYHDLTAAGVPFGFVFTRLSEDLGEDWSVTLSHEILELAMDPEVNILAEGPHPDPLERGRTVYHWYELCDAVQTITYQIDGVAVSDFVLPHYYTVGDEHENHNDFLGTGLPSFQVAEGGYAGFFDPETGRHETWTRRGDAKADKRRHVKSRFLGASRAGRHQGMDFSSPLRATNEVHCDAIMFELDRRDFPDQATAREYAARLAASTLGRDWRVRPVKGDPFEFDAIYHGGLTIGFADAWSLTHRIAANDSIVFAEPSISNPVPGETDLPTMRARTALRASGLGGEADLPGTENSLWAIEKCRVEKAWDIVRNDSKQPGAGIRIGHPDSGFRDHPELDVSRVLLNIDYDFLNDDDDPNNPKGNHGLSTASVIMSGTVAPHDRVVGPALYSEIVPMRVTKPGLVRPAPVLLFGGMRRLRDSIDHSVAIGCHVISISLGGVPSRSVHKAIIRAVSADVIVLAAAGNKVRFVVWPARYPETIAVAGSNINDEPWRGSSRGDNVDITAPAESVWRARVEEDDPEAVGTGDGTSYAVALTAGVACLWLAFHGRDALIQRFGHGRLQDEFRALLKHSANKTHALPTGDFGAGLVDAEKLLKTPLPAQQSKGRGRRSTRATSDDDEIRALATAFRVNDDRLTPTMHAEMLMAKALDAFERVTSGTEVKTARRSRAVSTPRPSVRGLSLELRSALLPK